MTSKAKNIEILRDNKIAVPNGFMLDAGHYRAMIAPITGSIIEALPSSRRIREIFLSAEIPDSSMAYLNAQLALFPGVKRFAVRSSGTVNDHGRSIREDSDETSLAGQFESFLNVSREYLPQAIRRCWASLFNERSIASFNADRGYVLSSAMSVLIQEMVHAQSSAVMMTVDPQSTGDVGAIEFTWGPCEAIVAGIASPDEITFHRDTGEILTTMIGFKECRVSYSPFNKTDRCNVIRVPTLPGERERLSVTTGTIKKMIRLGSQIERIFGCPQDVEAVIADDGQIVITQARPITVLPPAAKRTPFRASSLLTRENIL